MGTVDGPGIRTVVFLQGCALRCQYCHNPDTWHAQGGQQITPEALVKKLRRFQPYYVRSGGGVTFSGGEPLLQPDFLAECLRLCRAEGIHTCIDTAGVGLGDYDAILQNTDLVLYDVKHEDPAAYQALTGQAPTEPPYEFYPIRYWNPALSGGLENIIAKCVKSNPAERYQSCAELFYALDHYEEEDDVYRAAQKKKIRIFTAAAAGFVIFLAGGFLGLSLENWANTRNFDAIYRRAERETDQNEKEDLLMQCIALKPEETQPYEELANTYKADLSFGQEEEAQLTRALYQNLEELQGTENYPELAFEIGKLYWYYYDYGNGETNFVTKMKGAVQWFEDALDFGGGFENAEMAEVYRDIGAFNENITMDIEEASDAGKYAPYFEDLKRLTEQASQNPDEAEIVTLEVYRLDVDAVETYARKFRADGISQEELEALINQADAGLSGLDATTDKTEELKNTVTGRLDAARAAVERAFTDSRIPDSVKQENPDHYGD